MLDLMRRKKRLKAVLWLVIFGLSIGMLLFFVPGQNVDVGGISATAATVDGMDIPMRDYIDTYRRFIDSYSAGGKNRLDPETVKALGINRQALDSLIGVRVIESAAQRVGIKVTPEEVRQAIESNPALQDRGAFIGPERYKALLAANNIVVSQYEEGMRQMLFQKKLRNLVTNALEVSEQELRDDFVRNNVEAQVQFITLKMDDFTAKIKPSEVDLKAYFDAHRDQYKIGEQRRAQYLMIQVDTIADTVKVTQKELEEAWSKQSHDETVTASHILFEVKDAVKEAEVRTKAESVLARVKAGEDFAKLAKEFSEDSGSKAQGGDLGSFARGKMTKEFEDAAFAMKPGDISGLVRSQFGFHIIKVTAHAVPTLDSMRPSIERGIQIDKAVEILKTKSAEAQKLAEKEKDLNVIAKALGIPIEIRNTGFLARDSDPFASGTSQGLIDEVFRLKEIGEVGKMAQMPMGDALPKLLEVRQAKPPDMNDARAKVRADYIAAKAVEELQAQARRISEEAAKEGDLGKAAKKFGLAVKLSQNFKRDGTPENEIGNVPAFNAAAFEVPVGGLSQAIPLDGGKNYALLQVKSRTPFDEEAFQRQRSEIRERLLGTWRDSYFQEYVRRVMDDLEKAGKIRINPQALEQVAQARNIY